MFGLDTSSKKKTRIRIPTQIRPPINSKEKGLDTEVRKNYPFWAVLRVRIQPGQNSDPDPAFKEMLEGIF